MVLAIANRPDLADQPHMQQEEGELGKPMPCGSQSKTDPTLYCIKEVAHVGRHKYRPLGFEELVN